MHLREGGKETVDGGRGSQKSGLGCTGHAQYVGMRRGSGVADLRVKILAVLLLLFSRWCCAIAMLLLVRSATQTNDGLDRRGGRRALLHQGWAL